MNPKPLISAFVQKHIEHAKQAEQHLELPGRWQAYKRKIGRRETTRAAAEARAMAYYDALNMFRAWFREQGNAGPER